MTRIQTQIFHYERGGEAELLAFVRRDAAFSCIELMRAPLGIVECLRENTERRLLAFLATAGCPAEIAQEREDTTCWMQWRATARRNDFVGEPIRRVAKNGSVRIDDVRLAWKWDGRPKSCSGYA